MVRSFHGSEYILMLVIDFNKTFERQNKSFNHYTNTLLNFVLKPSLQRWFTTGLSLLHTKN